MKMKILVLTVAMMLVAVTVQAALWDPAVLNPSFEAPDTSGAWSQYVDDWFKQSWWGSFVESELGGGIPDTPHGVQWGGVSGDAQFQQIGTVEDNLDVPVSLLLGHRANNTQGDVTLSIWTGGDVTVLDDYDPASVYHTLTEVGAAQVDSVTLLDPWGAGNPGELLSTIAGTLNTGTSGTVGTPLWIQIETTGKVWVDNMVVPEPATLILL